MTVKKKKRCAEIKGECETQNAFTLLYWYKGGTQVEMRNEYCIRWC